MERFRIRVAGEKSGNVVAPQESLLFDEQMRLESRVYSLEKEVQILSNIMLIGIMVGGYFAYRWYLANVGSIPGVEI